MKDYLKYLKTKPKTIAWHIAVTVFCVAFVVTMICWDGLTSGWTIGMTIFAAAVFVLANYQPIYERKSAIKEAKRIKDYQDSLNK